MAVLKTFGADILKANVEARQAVIEAGNNLKQLGIRKVAAPSKGKKAAPAAKKAE